MLCKNTGTYRFLCTRWVLITIIMVLPLAQFLVVKKNICGDIEQSSTPHKFPGSLSIMYA